MRRLLSLCIAVLLMPTAGWAASEDPGADTQALFRSAQREVLFDDVAHYRFDVRVGPGQFDVIRLHRVVRERRPHQPGRTVDGVFLLPGGPNFFEAVFIPSLISEVPKPNQALATFLARHNIDVWGMDYAWALVPADTADFAFMRDWGVARDSANAQIALSLARGIRLLSGQGPGRLNVLGYSYGGILAYTIAGEETQRRRALRNVKGLIIADIGMRFSDESISSFYCAFAAADQANLDAGVYVDHAGAFLKQLAELALATPHDASPVVPGFTNRELALAFGTSTGLLTGQFWHFVGGFLDSNGLPTGLRFTDDRLWLDLLQAVPVNFPMRANFDGDALACGNIPVPFDDHLNEIALPILYVGAAGGFGTTGFLTTQLTASTDISRFIVQQLPDGQRVEDFAHGDLMLARDAAALVWTPILDWIVAHR